LKLAWLLTEAGLLKKLSLAVSGKLSRPRISCIRFDLASAGYCGLGVQAGVHSGYLTADSTQHDEIAGVSPLSLAGLADSIF
jgi:hypothetical protein